MGQIWFGGEDRARRHRVATGGLAVHSTTKKENIVIRQLLAGISLGAILVTSAAAQSIPQPPPAQSCEQQLAKAADEVRALSDQRDNALKGASQGQFEAADLRIQIRAAQDREQAIRGKVAELEAAWKAAQVETKKK